ncbi:carbohydrate kinase family protein [Melioribacter sp. OK-6-Me]|uniref:carbohydrate kinase family protein n=1 Tax=unclassified Melioribacter TaxID=2627329 RepID=UPI003ED8D994
MNIALVGHSIIDYISHYGKEYIRPGGIYYSALGMLSQINETDNVFLITGVDKNKFHLFNSLYSKLRTDFIFNLADMPSVLLITEQEGEREEIYKNLSDRLILPDIDWNRFDGILINMITGFDIDHQQLEKIRKNYKGLIYFDVHTLARGVDTNNKRFFRTIPEIEKWLSCIDILQCNQNELKTIYDYSDRKEAAAEIINHGVKIVLITKGNSGAELYYISGEQLETVEVKAEDVDEINKIGCGDIFGSVFFYSYLSTQDLNYSLKKANYFAALSVSGKIDNIIKAKL